MLSPSPISRVAVRWRTVAGAARDASGGLRDFKIGKKCGEIQRNCVKRLLVQRSFNFHSIKIIRNFDRLGTF